MKLEPIADYGESVVPPVVPEEPVVKVTQSPVQRQTDVKKGQRESMISIRKDYSYKYAARPKTPLLAMPEKLHNVDISTPSIASPVFNGASASSVQSNKVESFAKPSPAILKSRDTTKRTMNPAKPQISILERYDYDKGPSEPKLIKMDNNSPSPNSSRSAISSNKKSPSPAHSNKSHVPNKQSDLDDNKRKEVERERLKVVVAQKVESPVVKQELNAQSLKTPTTPTEPKDPQNINKINNKINIIFQLNDNTKSLRKNIILHRRAPKKNLVQKITIKEANNNQSDEAALVPDKVVVSTQTESLKQCEMSMTTTKPLNGEAVEHFFFEDDVLISIQQATISFYEFNRLGSLLKKGETDFKLIDRIPRRMHDTLVDSDNKFQRLCYNDHNMLPIYVEMRAKQKELDDPDMCPIAFLYCNVYYIDQRRAKFSSVHLDTVKSVLSDIVYTTVPGSSFIMAWNEISFETKNLVTGIVKYKLTPNLDLAKLASIRQFPKLNYRTKQMSCGKGNNTITIRIGMRLIMQSILDSQLVTFGDSQVSIFNYDSGDLLMSLDLMKSYGTNLATFEFKEVR